MKFTFKIQQYQTDAVEAAVDVFAGQSLVASRYRRDLGKITKTQQADLMQYMDADFEIGYKNADIDLSDAELLANIQRIQKSQDLDTASQALYKKDKVLKLDIEMETGTGKTYVYIKTLFELHRRYGWSKFIVVVPSIAIREGVQKTFAITQAHFMEHYGIKARCFVYNSKRLQELDAFSKDNALNVMIINCDSFNKTSELKEASDPKKNPIIFRKRDEFQSRYPIDVIKANRPIIILDEPQKMGGKATQSGILKFNPLFILNYSATHKVQNHMIYVLDALEAYNQRLVKKIEVKGFELKNLKGLDSYLYLAGFVLSPKDPPKARLEFEVAAKTGVVSRKIRLCEEGDDLFHLSNEMKQYKGFSIAELNPQRGFITFTNGKSIAVGDILNDNEQKKMRRIQIRETIQSHFDKEEKLFNQGIKTLSLFFIDEVARYRQYGEGGEEVLGEYGRIFEEEYAAILYEKRSLLDTAYQRYLQETCSDISRVHQGYFSIDKGKAVNSTVKRGSDISDDVSAYELILKDKERLLSFEEPTRFIFSHSALREGWDNPNVFQICTLKHSQNEIAKRQEVGRGLRLCVNQEGNRIDSETCGSLVHDINKLTVIASESYASFVTTLQKELQDSLHERATKATVSYFEGKVIRTDDGQCVITKKHADLIHKYLIRHNYIDDDDLVTDVYKDAVTEGTLAPLPVKLQEDLGSMADGVHILVQSIFDASVLDKMVDNGHTPEYNMGLNENFSKREFQALWEKIQHKYAYKVAFDSEELVTKVIKAIDATLSVAVLRYTLTRGEQKEVLDQHELERKASFTLAHTRTKDVDSMADTHIAYDLIGEIAKGAKLTRKTVVRILSGIDASKFALFKGNPEEFISKVIRCIMEQKATMIVEHISYNRTHRSYDSTIFTMEKPHFTADNLLPTQKHIKDFVATDSKTEAAFAKALEVAGEVCVYAKLPRAFHIPTPVGNYAPDWAISFNEGAVKHVFFVAETKGSMNSLELSRIEATKISCAKRHFEALSRDMLENDGKHVKYDFVNSYDELMNKVMG